jgi:hypothetical protein
VAKGEEYLLRQRGIIDRLEQLGYDSLDAIFVLEELQDMYALHKSAENGNDEASPGGLRLLDMPRLP